MQDPNRLDLATRAEITEVAPESILMVPLGAVEQHGDHLAVGLDYFLAQHIAHRVAQRLAGSPNILITPPLPFGYSEHHLPFGGTLSLSAKTLLSVLVDLGLSADCAGFRRLFFINGHGGNVELSALAGREISLQTDMRVAAGSYWTMAASAIAELDPSALGQIPGHAGGFETSLALALDPDLVRAPIPARDDVDGRGNRLPKYTFATFSRQDWMRIDGRTDSASLADADLGGRILETIIVSVSEQVRAFAASTDDEG